MNSYSRPTDSIELTIDGFKVVDDNSLVSWSENRLNLWDIGAGKCQQQLSAHQTQIKGVIPLTDARFVSWNKEEIYLWEIETFRSLRFPIDEPINQLVAFQDQALIAWKEIEPDSSYDLKSSLFSVWHTGSPEPANHFFWQGSYLGHSPETGKILVEDSGRNEIKIFNGLKGGKYLSRIDINHGSDSKNADQMIGNPDVTINLAKDLFLFSSDFYRKEYEHYSPIRQYEVWDMHSCLRILKADTPGGLVTGATLINGRLLLWKENQLFMWDLHNQTLVYQFNGHTTDIFASYILSEYKLVSYSSSELCIHDLNTGVITNTLEFPKKNLCEVEHISEENFLLLFHQSLQFYKLDLSKLPEKDLLEDELSKLFAEMEKAAHESEDTPEADSDDDSWLDNFDDDEDGIQDREENPSTDEDRSGPDSQPENISNNPGFGDDLDMNNEESGKDNGEGLTGFFEDLPSIKDLDSVSETTTSHSEDGVEVEEDLNPLWQFQDYPINNFFKELKDLPPEVSSWTDLLGMENTIASASFSKLQAKPTPWDFAEIRPATDTMETTSAKTDPMAFLNVFRNKYLTSAADLTDQDRERVEGIFNSFKQMYEKLILATKELLEKTGSTERDFFNEIDENADTIELLGKHLSKGENWESFRQEVAERLKLHYSRQYEELTSTLCGISGDIRVADDFPGYNVVNHHLIQHLNRVALLQVATLAQDLPLINFLVKQGYKFTQKELIAALHKAVLADQTGTVEALLSVSPDICLQKGESDSVLSKAAELGKAQLIPILLSHSSLDNPEIIRGFLWATLSGHEKISATLANAIQNLGQMTPTKLVSMAADENYTGILKVLKENGLFHENQLFSALSDKIHRYYLGQIENILFRFREENEEASSLQEWNRLYDRITLNYPDIDIQQWEDLPVMQRFRNMGEALDSKQKRSLALQPLSEFPVYNLGNSKPLSDLLMEMYIIFSNYSNNVFAVADSLLSIENEIFSHSLKYLIDLHSDFFPPDPEAILEAIREYLDSFITPESNALYQVVRTGILHMADNSPFDMFGTAILDHCDWKEILMLYRNKIWGEENSDFLRSYLENRFPDDIREMSLNDTADGSEDDQDGDGEGLCDPLLELDQEFRNQLFEAPWSGRNNEVRDFYEKLEREKWSDYEPDTWENLELLYEDLASIENDIKCPLVAEVKKDVSNLADQYFKFARDTYLQIAIAFGDVHLSQFPLLTDTKLFAEIQTNSRFRQEKLLELASVNRNDRLIDILLNQGILPNYRLMQNIVKTGNVDLINKFLNVVPEGRLRNEDGVSWLDEANTATLGFLLDNTNISHWEIFQSALLAFAQGKTNEFGMLIDHLDLTDVEMKLELKSCFEQNDYVHLVKLIEGLEAFSLTSVHIDILFTLKKGHTEAVQQHAREVQLPDLSIYGFEKMASTSEPWSRFLLSDPGNPVGLYWEKIISQASEADLAATQVTVLMAYLEVTALGQKNLEAIEDGFILYQGFFKEIIMHHVLPLLLKNADPDREMIQQTAERILEVIYGKNPSPYCQMVITATREFIKPNLSYNNMKRALWEHCSTEVRQQYLRLVPHSPDDPIVGQDVL